MGISLITILKLYNHLIDGSGPLIYILSLHLKKKIAWLHNLRIPVS